MNELLEIASQMANMNHESEYCKRMILAYDGDINVCEATVFKLLSPFMPKNDILRNKISCLIRNRALSKYKENKKDLEPEATSVPVTPSSSESMEPNNILENRFADKSAKAKERRNPSCYAKSLPRFGTPYTSSSTRFEGTKVTSTSFRKHACLSPFETQREINPPLMQNDCEVPQAKRLKIQLKNVPDSQICMTNAWHIIAKLVHSYLDGLPEPSTPKEKVLMKKLMSKDDELLKLYKESFVLHVDSSVTEFKSVWFLRYLDACVNN